MVCLLYMHVYVCVCASIRLLVIVFVSLPQEMSTVILCICSIQHRVAFFLSSYFFSFFICSIEFGNRHILLAPNSIWIRIHVSPNKILIWKLWTRKKFVSIFVWLRGHISLAMTKRNIENGWMEYARGVFLLWNSIIKNRSFRFVFWQLKYLAQIELIHR